jgi:hypothetical protein
MQRLNVLTQGIKEHLAVPGCNLLDGALAAACLHERDLALAGLLLPAVDNPDKRRDLSIHRKIDPGRQRRHTLEVGRQGRLCCIVLRQERRLLGQNVAAESGLKLLDIIFGGSQRIIERQHVVGKVAAQCLTPGMHQRWEDDQCEQQQSNEDQSAWQWRQNVPAIKPGCSPVGRFVCHAHALSVYLSYRAATSQEGARDRRSS